MRIFASMLSGFVLTLAIFAGGVVSAVALLDADPVPVRKLDMDSFGLWTAKAVRIDNTSQDFERLPAESIASAGEEAAPEDLAATLSEEALIDTTTTASLPADATPHEQEKLAATMNAAHVEWCSGHYRSYRPETNSYTPFSGGQRECVSPFSGNLSGTGETVAEEPLEGELVGYATGAERSGYNLTVEHIQSCFARYRSYRPEDNTYQPYGGGPRRQCR